MKNIPLPFAALILCLFALTAFAGQSKENDIDVNYDESKVPKYDLPPFS